MITRRYLQALPPEYVLGEVTATLSLSNGTLRLAVATQPQYELVPKWGLSFDAKGLPSSTVEFKKDPSGRVMEHVDQDGQELPNERVRHSRSGQGNVRLTPESGRHTVLRKDKIEVGNSGLGLRQFFRNSYCALFVALAGLGFR
jgi:hypothetical protein